eukprot:1193316-Prorocentrum_minimum.AAC.1
MPGGVDGGAGWARGQGTPRLKLGRQLPQAPQLREQAERARTQPSQRSGNSPTRAATDDDRSRLYSITHFTEQYRTFYHKREETKRVLRKLGELLKLVYVTGIKKTRHL